ncbi:F-box only protein 47-like [Cheilinus undulatus]|uniref:F-box only protein 47-like n=1 Tax=Cheilinus undulatus TaxID=241271 RepID=UPI001BD3A983|nr:F-box only protein 47-like [Cheilinus undulatus]
MVKRNSRNKSRNTSKLKSHYYQRTHLRPRPHKTIITRSQCNTVGSFFHSLPSEVFDMVLDKLSVLDISVFTMVSKDITQYVMDYISTVTWKNKMIFQNFHYSTCLEQRSSVGHYRDLGLLFKRCTLLLPTKERLKFIFGRLSQIPCFILEHCSAQACIGFSCYGVLLQTLIAGWDELECHRVFNFLCEHTNLLQKMKAVVTRKPGVKLYQEMQLRLFCRQVFLDPWPNQLECQFWLLKLLKPWPLVSQARLLFILYGPVQPEGTLGWQDMVERSLPHNNLCDLARALLLLLGKIEVEGQTSTMLAILEELTVIPQPWHGENVARVLVLCGSSLCYNVLASKAINGRLPEIARLLIYIILVCEKDGYHMSWVVKLVQQIYKVFSTPPEKFSFIQKLESTFSEVTREFFEFSFAGDHLDDRETFQTLCILLDSSAHFHTKLLQMLFR